MAERLITNQDVPGSTPRWIDANNSKQILPLLPSVFLVFCENGSQGFLIEGSAWVWALSPPPGTDVQVVSQQLGWLEK